MKRLRHRLFTALAATSFLLFLSTAVLWSMHLLWAKAVHLQVGDPRSFQFDSQFGYFMFDRFCRPSDLGLPERFSFDAYIDPDEQAESVWAVRTFFGGTWHEYRGFGVMNNHPQAEPLVVIDMLTRQDLVALKLPDWFATLSLAILPAIYIARRLRNKKRYTKGNCPTCGYDLRATPDRCPECGTVVLTKVV